MNVVERHRSENGSSSRAGSTTWRSVDPREYSQAQWDGGLPEDERITSFHRHGWLNALSETYGYRPRFFIKGHLSEGLDGLAPLMEVRSPVTGIRAVSLPFTDHCESIVPSGHSEGCRQALFCDARSRRWGRVDFHGTPAIASSNGSEMAPAWKRYYQHRLVCHRDPQAQRAALAGSHRRSVRRAAENDVRVDFSHSWESVREYYALHCKTRKRHGAPPQPLSWFRSLHRHCLGEGKGFVAIARKGETPISGGVFLVFRNRAIYKYGASDYRFSELRGANAVFWHVLRKLADEHYEELDFGVTSMEHSGLRRFKLGWGVEEKILNYYRYDLARDSYIPASQGGKRGVRSEALLSRAPVWFLRLVGKVLYRHVA